jgi:hypothetical protein
MKTKTYTERHRNGKGDKPRPGTYGKQYQENWDLIDWSKNKKEKLGKYKRELRATLDDFE